MRNYIPGTWEIRKERYIELRAFCQQYPQWKIEAASMLGVTGVGIDDMPHGSDPGDPTGKAVERREVLITKIYLVERCAAAIERGSWYQALILNICSRMSWETIRDLYPELLKTSDRTKFFKARRMFFNLLDKEKDKSILSGQSNRDI